MLMTRDVDAVDTLVVIFQSLSLELAVFPLTKLNTFLGSDTEGEEPI